MDIYRLIQAFEKLIFEVASWFVFLPVTLAFTLFRPNHIHKFVLEEFKKEPQERFQNRMSPPLFWAIIGILPAFVSLESWRSPDVESFLDSYILSGWTIETKLFALSVALLSGPTAFSVAIQLLQRKVLTRSGLEPYFYSQCYIFAPFQLAFAVCALILLDLLAEAIVHSLFSGLSAGGILSLPPLRESWMLKYGDYLLMTFVLITASWFIVSECLFISHAVYHGQPRLRRFLLVVCTFLISVVLWVAMISIWIFGSKFVIDIIKHIDNRQSQGTLDGSVLNDDLVPHNKKSDVKC